MEKGYILEAEGLKKTFYGTEGRIEVLKGLDVRVGEGEVVAIIGPSGVGKSTLLHILGSLDVPDAGRVSIKGKEVFSLKERELVRLRNRVIGFIFQFHYLMPDFTALENVMMPSLVAGTSIERARENGMELLERVGLAGRFQHKPSELSGGEQQRVAVARAFANDPEIVLADEPTGNLDDEASEGLTELIIELSRRKGKTFVVVTHRKDITAHAGRVLLLKDGVLQEMGHP